MTDNPEDFPEPQPVYQCGPPPLRGKQQPVPKPNPGAVKDKRVYRKSAGVTDPTLIPLPVFDDMDQCAAVAFIPKSIQRAAKKRGCSAFKHSRIDLAVLLKFLFMENKDQPVGNWKDMFDEARARREMLRLSKDEGQSIDRTDVMTALAKATAAFFSAVDREFTLTLPAALRGLSEQAIKDRLVAAVETFKGVLRTELSALIVREENVNETHPTQEKESKQNESRNTTETHRVGRQ